MKEPKKTSDLSLTVFFEDDKLKECFIKFFSMHSPSVEQYLEVTYATEGFGDSDPRIVIGKNSIGVERFNKNRGIVMTLDGLVNYSELKDSQLFAEIDKAHGMAIIEKGKEGEKDKRIGVGGDLAIVIQKMVEIEASKDGLDKAIESAKEQKTTENV